jgi:hypothetical protein
VDPLLPRIGESPLVSPPGLIHGAHARMTCAWDTNASVIAPPRPPAPLTFAAILPPSAVEKTWPRSPADYAGSVVPSEVAERSTRLACATSAASVTSVFDRLDQRLALVSTHVVPLVPIKDRQTWNGYRIMIQQREYPKFKE